MFANTQTKTKKSKKKKKKKSNKADRTKTACIEGMDVQARHLVNAFQIDLAQAHELLKEHKYDVGATWTYMTTTKAQSQPSQPASISSHTTASNRSNMPPQTKNSEMKEQRERKVPVTVKEFELKLNDPGRDWESFLRTHNLPHPLTQVNSLHFSLLLLDL